MPRRIPLVSRITRGGVGGREASMEAGGRPGYEQEGRRRDHEGLWRRNEGRDGKAAWEEALVGPGDWMWG